MHLFPLVILLSLTIVSARVSFDKAEVLDDVDLRGTNTHAAFRCRTGCRVYSPTRNDKLWIMKSDSTSLRSLMDLAEWSSGEYCQLPAGEYHLESKGAKNPSFVFYAVELDAPNIQTPVIYVNSSTALSIDPSVGSLITFMSDSGAVRFGEFAGDYTEAFPTVHATGFDVVDSESCRPVYTARSASSILNTAITLMGPIATLDFNSTRTGISVQVSGNSRYVGCDVDSLYTNTPTRAVTATAFTVSALDTGLSLDVNGDYSIEFEPNAVKLTVNDDVQELFGDDSISQHYESSSFHISVDWSKNYSSTDRFALQIDFTPNTRTTMATGESTTSEAHALGTFLACTAISLLFLTE